MKVNQITHIIADGEQECTKCPFKDLPEKKLEHCVAAFLYAFGVKCSEHHIAECRKKVIDV